MKPTMGLNTSAKTLNLQSSLKAADLDANLHSQFVNRQKSWSNRPTSRHVTSFGEGLFVQEYVRTRHKRPRRVGPHHFQVRYEPPTPSPVPTDASFGGDVIFNQNINPGSRAAGEMDVDDFDCFKNVPIPLFSRVRSVTIDDDNVMHCSCKKFECRGHFCADQISVAELVHEHNGASFEGFTHHDVAMRYWISFMHLAYKSTTPLHIQKHLHSLCNNEVTGPKLRCEISDTLSIEPPSEPQSALERLKNYDPSCIDMKKVEGMHCFTYQPSANEDGALDVESVFDDMFDEIQTSTPNQFERWFEVISDPTSTTSLSTNKTASRATLRPLIDTAYKLADRLGHDAISKLEQTIADYNQWCSVELAEKDDAKNAKRKYVAFSQEDYEGTAKRVFNTHHM